MPHVPLHLLRRWHGAMEAAGLDAPTREVRAAIRGGAAEDRRDSGTLTLEDLRDEVRREVGEQRLDRIVIPDESIRGIAEDSVPALGRELLEVAQSETLEVDDLGLLPDPCDHHKFLQVAILQELERTAVEEIEYRRSVSREYAGVEREADLTR